MPLKTISSSTDTIIEDDGIRDTDLSPIANLTIDEVLGVVPPTKQEVMEPKVEEQKTEEKPKVKRKTTKKKINE